MNGSGVPGDVLVVGTGLIGTSVALALRAEGVRVHLADADPARVDAAVARGAGSAGRPDVVGLVVVAVPPDALAAVVCQALGVWPDAVVTDVGSVKAEVAARVLGTDPAGAERYVGGHPMAGSERSGPQSASASLFRGRAWAVTPHERSAEAAVELVARFAELCGGVVATMSPLEHDRAVALVSHVPHLLSAAAAAQLVSAPAAHLVLAGQGLRDVTRVAAADPALWVQVLTANAEPVRAVLRTVRDDLDAVLGSLASDPGGEALADVLARGRRGTQRIAPVTPSPDVAGHSGVAGLVVAVDGPSGSGKSSTAREVATRLGLRYLDTGAMYRAMTWALLRRGMDVGDAEAVAAAARDVVVEPGTDPAAPKILADGVDVAVPIRGDAVTRAVSAVSAVPAVRAMLVELQRQVIGAGSIVVEGRDIGSTVAPNAPVKVFLVADPAARAQRRAAQTGTAAALETLKQEMARRDRLDSSRRTSPLVQAPDAVVIDTTELSLDEVVERVLEVVRVVPAAQATGQSR